MLARSLARIVPRPARHAILRAIESNLPMRWQLPWINAKLQAQGALEEEISWLAKVLHGRAGVAIDVGANVGLYTYHLARLCERVEAFEPNVQCSEVLKAYGAPNVRVHDVALSSRAGTATLSVPIVDGVQQTGLASLNGRAAGAGTSLEVSMRDLDSYAFENVRFIKIDVEGHEVEVVAGSSRTLESNHPILLVEVEQRHQTRPIRDVFDLVTAKDYEGYFIFEGALQPISRFEVEYHQQGFAAGVQKVKYVNNFLFLPQGTPPPQ